MNVALIGASGYVGSAVLAELLRRGHRVTVLVRHPNKLQPHERLSVVPPERYDLYDPASLAPVLSGRDAVVSAFNPGHDDPEQYRHSIDGARSIIAATKRARVPRLAIVGGAGSLEVAPGAQLVDTPTFPAQWKAGASAMRDILDLVRQEPELDWTYLSPAAELVPGERTGKFRLGGDQLLRDADGHSRVSTADFAVALVDELEQPRHPRARFSVAY